MLVIPHGSRSPAWCSRKLSGGKETSGRHCLFKEVPQRLYISDRFKMKGRKVWSFWMTWSSCIALMASTFSGLGCTPSALNSMPKNVIVVSLIWHLSKLKTNPCCCATNIRLCKFASWSFSVGPCTATSSAIPTVPGYFSRKKSIFCWKTSWLTHKKEDG